MKIKKKMVIQCCSGICNSGDEAILQTLINQYYKEYEISVISQNFHNTSLMHPAIKTCDRYRSCCDAIRECDVFLLGGGGLLQDETTIYNVGKWLYYLRMAIRYGKKTVVYANSIGPLNWKINRLLVKRYLNQVDLITLRDEVSAELLKEIGVDKTDVYVTADPVFSLPVERIDEKKGYVCMALRHWYDIHPLIPVSICNKLHIRSKKNQKRYEAYIGVMAAVTDYINKVWGKNVVFLSFLYERDGAVARDILERVQSKENKIIEEKYMPVGKAVAVIGDAELLVGMRLHSIIYAICSGTPVLPVIYSSKVRSILKFTNMEEYGISMEELQEEKMIEFLNKVWKEKEKQKLLMKEQYCVMKERESKNKRLLEELIEKDKIVMIGPVYPYKGGISHYTGLMCKALRDNYHVVMVSFKMQYPKLLFKKEQKDYSNDYFAVEQTKFWLNTVNPFNIIYTAGKIKDEKPKLIIIQWWHPYFSPCYWILQNCLKKLIKDCKILLICHNVYPHERFPLDKLLTGMALKPADCYLVQSKRDEADLITIVKKPKYKRVVHPTYDFFKMQGLSLEEARKKIGLEKDDKVILFFGFVRRYKGLHYLLEALPVIREKISEIKLMIVGDFEDDKEEYLEKIERYNLYSNLILVQGYCPDAEVEQYFAASNLVVLPYESATQSGIAQIAYGFRKPVIATDVGGLPEVVTEEKTGYVVPPMNSDKLAEAVIRFFEENREEEFAKNIEQEKERFSWNKMVEEIIELTGLNE